MQRRLELELHARTPTQHGERFPSRFLCFPELVVAFYGAPLDGPLNNPSDDALSLRVRDP